MRRELTIIGGRQAGKSYRLMKIAIEDALAGKRVLFTTNDYRTIHVRFQDLEQMIRSDPMMQPWKACRANGKESFAFDRGGRIEFSSLQARSSPVGRVDTHLIDNVPIDPLPEAEHVVRTAFG